MYKTTPLVTYIYTRSAGLSTRILELLVTTFVGGIPVSLHLKPDQLAKLSDRKIENLSP